MFLGHDAQEIVAGSLIARCGKCYRTVQMAAPFPFFAVELPTTHKQGNPLAMEVNLYTEPADIVSVMRQSGKTLAELPVTAFFFGWGTLPKDMHDERWHCGEVESIWRANWEDFGGYFEVFEARLAGGLRLPPIGRQDGLNWEKII